MKKILFILVSIIIFSCDEKKCDNKELITVYGDLHMISQGMILGDDDYLVRAHNVQKWLNKSVNEGVVMIESTPYNNGEIITFESLNMSADDLEYIASRLYDVRYKFMYDGVKEMYGAESLESMKIQQDFIDQIGLDSLDNNIDKFFQLNDLRNESILKNAKELSSKKCQPIAIILGEAHLEWFKERGYKVKYAFE